MKHIICFHLLNDYSGSPKVLQTVLKGLLDKGYSIDLYTSDGGALDNLLPYGNLKKVSCFYYFSSNSAITLLRYIKVQIVTFLLSFRYLFDREAVFYINTVLPFGPALAGWLMRKPVIYHCHEFVTKKGLAYRILGGLMQLIATEIICVSNSQRDTIKRKHNVRVIPNAIPKEVAERLSLQSTDPMERKTVLMLSSLKSYKGISEFIKIAGMLPQYHFDLVINDTESNINAFLELLETRISDNVRVYPRQADVVPFYTRASVVLNLSDKNRFVETSGLTILEAIMAGLPVIVPTVGGCSEMIRNGVCGYKIDVQDMDEIARKIDCLLSDKDLYDNLRDNTLRKRAQCDSGKMINSILTVIDE